MLRSVQIYHLLIPTVMFLYSCSPSTSITATWKADPEKSYNFKSIAIIGIANDADIRKTVENSIENELTLKGFRATGALMFLPPHASKENISREIVMEFLEFNQFDGVITVGLVRKEETSRHVPGQYYYVPGWDVPFNDYYGQMSNYYYSPGYYEESVTFLLQTNLYSFPDGKLLWSAQSKTSPLRELTPTADILAKELTKELVGKNVIIP